MCKGLAPTFQQATRQLLFLTIVLALCGPVHGQEVRFTPIYRTDLGSGGPSLSNRTTPGISPDGTKVTFHESFSSSLSGIYLASGNAVSRVVTRGTGSFTTIYHSQGGFGVNNRGEIAFLGDRDGHFTNYVYRGLTPVRVGTQYTPQQSFVRINDAGITAFAQGPNTSTVEIYSGTENGLTLRSGGHPSGFWDPRDGAHISDTNSVAFHARHTNFSVFLSRNDSLQEIVTSFSGTSGDPSSPFSSAFCYGISGTDEVLVSTTLRAGGTGLYRWVNGNLSPIVTSADGFYDFGGNYLNGSSQPAMNRLGNTAFVARDDLGLHIFLTRENNQRVPLFSSGSTIDGLQLETFSFGANSFSDNGKLAFYAKFTNGVKGIYTVEVVPETHTLLVLFTSGGYLVLRRQRKHLTR